MVIGVNVAQKGDDLFSELKLSESTQFKAEMTELQHKLEEAQRSAEVASSEVNSKQERINQLQNELDLIMGVQRRADNEFESNANSDGTDAAPSTGGDEDTASAGLKRTLRQTETRYSVALRQIASMQHELWRYQELEKVNADPALAGEEGLKAEVLRLRKELENRAEEIKHLEERIDNGAEEAQQAGLKTAVVSVCLRRGFADLLKLYMLVCSELKETPSKQVGGRVKTTLNVFVCSQRLGLVMRFAGDWKDGQGMSLLMVDPFFKLGIWWWGLMSP